MVVGDFSLTEADTNRESVVFIGAGRPAQADAAVRWLRSRYPGLVGRIVAEHTGPIAMSFDPENLRLEIGTVVSLWMRQTVLLQEAQSWAELIHEPFIPLSPKNLATTSHLQYSGKDLNVRWVRDESTITGFFGAFSEAAGNP